MKIVENNQPTWWEWTLFAFQSSSMVEHAVVNRVVVGSSPTSGAIFDSGCSS